MSVVLAIEPDRAQAEALREVLNGRFGARLEIVASNNEAMDTIDRELPDLVLVSALLSPRDEDELVAYLRRLDEASHLQLLTIPQLARPAAAPPPEKGSLFGFGKNKKKRITPAPEGCDPAAFATQVEEYLTRAREVRRRPRPANAPRPGVPAPVQPVYEAAAPPAAAWPDAHASTPQHEPDVEPLSAAFTFESLPPVTALPDPAAVDVDRLIERLGFGPDTEGSDVMAPDATLLSASEEQWPLPSPDPLARTRDPRPKTQDPSSKTKDSRPKTRDERRETRDERRRQDQVLDLAAAPLPPSFGVFESTPANDFPVDGEPLIELAPEPLNQPVFAAQARADVEPLIDIAVTTGSTADDHGSSVAISEPVADDEVAIDLDRLDDLVPDIDLAQIRAEAEGKLAAELERVQTEAAQRREAELAQWQAEAEALREATIARARADAETEAREALAAELARTRAESEHLRHEELARLQAEADARLEDVTHQARQVAEAEAARAFAEELTRVRADSESAAARALEDEVSRVRADADARLQAELERVRREAEDARRAQLAEAAAEAERLREAAAREARAIAEQAANRALEAELTRVRAEADARLAEQRDAQANAEKLREAAAREAQVNAERLREAAAREARAIAEATASRTLQAEVARVREEADARLASELAQLRADAERRRETELEDVRRQVEQMREAAAEQARSAAAEAIAAEVARAAAQRAATAAQRAATAPRTVPFVRAAAPNSPAAPVSPAVEPRPVAEAVPTESADSTGASSYYDLWRQESSAQETSHSPAPMYPLGQQPPWFRRKRWLLAAAATLLLAIGATVRVDTTAWRHSATRAIASAIPASRPEKEPSAPAAPAAPVTGHLLVETTPKGAKVLVDGKPRGQTPLTVRDLTPGRHKVVLESSDGVVIRRDVIVRAGERAVTSELMVSGWLSVFSRIPLEIRVNGRRVGSSTDGQIMLSPGRQKVMLVNERFNFRETRTIEIQAGAIASQTVTLPSGTLHVDAPAGAEVFVDNERVGTAPLRDLSVTIGTREIRVTHADVGDHRQTIEVKHGVPTTIAVEGRRGSVGDSFDGLKVLSESAANPGLRRTTTAKPRP